MIKEFLSHNLSKKEVRLILALILVAVAPLLLQRNDTVESGDEDVRLIVMTPHNATIQSEFGAAFTEYWYDKTGEKVFIDWRTPGGASEIRVILEGDFKRAEESGREGINMDVMFGGGEYLFKKLADKGRLAKLAVFEKHKEWFGDHGIREHFSGERCYDEKYRWLGVCMSEFGICYNTDGIKRIGVKPPETWDDLADPRYFGKIALADPTKSGSVARAFEMLIQQKIQAEMRDAKKLPGESAEDVRNRCIREGWSKGMTLIKKISANARYFTDSATKIPHDVAQGDAVAGMCVDFYGRAYNQKYKKADGSSRLIWISPKGGTSTSVDPAAVFRGAPSPKVAQGFIEFLLSDHGQLLWNKKPGTKNGPKLAALRRLPVRPDVYTPETLKDFTDADQIPYEREGGLIYDESITGGLFDALREEIRVMCITTHDELAYAWQALIENSDDQGNMHPDALRRFEDVAQFSYQKSKEIKRMLEKRQQGDKSDRQMRTLRASDKLNVKAAIFRRAYVYAANKAKDNPMKRSQ